MTERIKGLNWADTRDNFQAGILYLSGLGAADTYDSAAVVADRIVEQMYALTGANTVRLPINEPTVGGGYWDTYIGAIDAALAKGRVILCYWAVKDGRPADQADFLEMWTAVVGRYGSHEHVFIEPINEPSGFDPAALNDFYAEWLRAFPNLPRERVILDGSKCAQVPATVGADERLDGCLLGYHEYSFFDKVPSEAEWRAHMREDVGGHHGRTVCTEFGAVMGTGVLGKRRIDAAPDYGLASDDEYVRYVRGVTAQFREWRMGSVYWPGLRDGDTYALCARSGSGRDTALSLNNASGLARIHYAWGD